MTLKSISVNAIKILKRDNNQLQDAVTFLNRIKVRTLLSGINFVEL